MQRRRSTRPSRAPSRGGPSPAVRRRRFWNYPRPGYTGLHRWLPSWRFLLQSAVALVFLAVGLVAAAYWSVDVPAANASVQDQTTSVYFAPTSSGSPHGELIGQLPGTNRQIVDYSTLPASVGQAVIASEDQTFFSNPGVDLRGILRALVNNLRGRPIQGASTLTEQYVENYYLGSTHDYVGKVKETLIALKITRSESKEQILGRYLNTIYFGRGAYGIQAASQAYFGIDAKDLTASQSAMLAGIIPSPSNWDPAVNQDKAQARWSRTLDYMVELGYLSPADRAAATFPATIAVQTSQVYAGPYGYIMEQARKDAATSLGISEEEVMRGGYSIVTTVNKQLQDEAVRSAADLIAGTLSDGKAPDPNLKIAITSVDPSTGAILSMYSGQNFLTDQYNRVTRDAVQAGSTFKPFTLLAALEQGIPLSTKFSGANDMKIDGWDTGDSTVQNFSNESDGRIDLVTATAKSVNTVYAQLNMKVGPANTMKAAQTAGITTALTDAPSNVLGVDAVHPLDMASAYGVLAAQGMRASPHLIGTVLNPSGSVAFTGGSTPTRVFSADVVSDAVYAMEHVVDSPNGTAHGAIAPLDRHIAGKTGTSTNNKSAWFVGFTSQISTAVALSQTAADGKGQDSITPVGGVTQVTGGTWPAALWADYMEPVLAMPQYSDDSAFPDPAKIGTATTAPTATATDDAPATTQAPASVTVPDGLAGKLEADASAAVLAAGLQPAVQSEASDSVPVGRVVRADPATGTSVAAGSTVTLVVSTGPATPTPVPTPVPTVTPSVPARPTPTPTATSG